MILSVKLKNAVKKMLGEKADELGFEIKNIRINGSPKGCSGFIYHKETGKTLYVTTEPLNNGITRGQIMYRTAKHLKDYTGGYNRWVSFQQFVDSEVERTLF